MSFEFTILNFIYDNCHNEFLDTLMIFVTKLGDLGLIWIFLALVLLINPKYRKAGFAMAIALLLATILSSLILKPLLARIRPFDINTAVELLISAPRDYSFPSGHTTASFAATFALYFSGLKIWKPAFVLAILMGFSRLYLYVHYPTDVMAGAAIGIFMGYLGFRAIKKAPNK